jgi:hypothetical protein
VLDLPSEPDPLEYPKETDAIGRSEEEDEGPRAQAL